MENLREQIHQKVNDFLIIIQQLTEQHTALALQETFSSLGNRSPAATPAKAAPATADRPRGAKRDAQELEQLSALLLQFVGANPGLRIEQINKQLGTTTAELALPIRKLVSSKSITAKGQKRSTTYFAGKGAAKRSAPETVTSDEAGVDKVAGKQTRAKKKRPKSKSKK